MCVLLALVLAKPRLWSLLVGLGLALGGLFLRTWACGHLEKQKKLIMTGPYQHTRNPLYFGNLLIGIGVVVSALSFWIFTVFLVLFLVFYPVVILSEKQKMEQLFPGEYATYKEKVPLFFPSLKPSLLRQTTPFSWSLYKKNKEYRALIGTTLFWIGMTGRLFF